MTIEPTSALRLAGWSFGQGHYSMSHFSGAVVRVRQGVFSAERADGSKRLGIPSQADAIAWSLGLDITTGGACDHRSRNVGKSLLPPGWTGTKGLYKHARGTVETGHQAGKFRAQLINGVREMFKLRDDALRWVEGGGTFKPGHVRDERKP